jgi:dUTP pyrophosphatase
MPTKHPHIAVSYLGTQAYLPRYASALASGADLLAHIDVPVTLLPSARVLIPTGVSLEIPVGYEAQVRSRSGLSLNHGIVCLNSPGTIDADYRGEVGVILINLSQESFDILPKMRIAQLVFAPVLQAEFSIKIQLSPSSRDQGGFGSTGL